VADFLNRRTREIDKAVCNVRRRVNKTATIETVRSNFFLQDNGRLAGAAQAMINLSLAQGRLLLPPSTLPCKMRGFPVEE